MITTLIRATNHTTVIGSREFEDQLQADLATGVRGGNKARLIARAWVYGAKEPHDIDAYLAFKASLIGNTFAQIHQAFDHVLPNHYRASGHKELVPASVAQPITRKATKLAASFDRTPDLTPVQRDWVTAHGGVIALDKRRIQLFNGRSFPVLDTSWHITAQRITKLMTGKAILLPV